MSGKNAFHSAPSSTPWDGIPDELLDPAQRAAAGAHRSIYRFRHERCADDPAFFNAYPRECCPACGSIVVKNGTRANGLQRYRCTACGKTSTPVTGTIFDNSKLPVAAWVDFILQAVSFESVSAMTREDRRADTTPPYWMAKLFSVLEGIQDDVILSGRIWIDETYWPVADRDAVRKPDGKLPRGLSKNQICIAVGIDDSGRKLFVREGVGKPNKGRTWDAYGAHIEAGSTLVHDMESAHDILVDRLSLESECHNSRLLKGIPDKQNPLEPVNRMCFMVKRFLGAHQGFDREDMQGYLDLLHVAMSDPADKLEKVALVLDRAMRCPKTLRFRDFYNVNPGSETKN